MASLFTSGRFYGPPLGTLKTYAAGTLTPLATYTTQAGATANPTTINIPASGYAAVWLGDGLAYRMIVADANGVVLYDEDNIIAAGEAEAGPVVDDALRDDLADSTATAGKGASLVALRATRNYVAGTIGWALNNSGIDVTLPPINADPTGSINCSSAIQSFVLDQGLSPRFCEGTFLAGGLQFKSSGQRLLGAGKHKTILKAPAGTTYVIATPAPGVRVDVDVVASRVFTLGLEIHDLSIDITAMVNADTSRGVFMEDGWDWTIRNVRIIDPLDEASARWGIYLGRAVYTTSLYDVTCGRLALIGNTAHSVYNFGTTVYVYKLDAWHVKARAYQHCMFSACVIQKDADKFDLDQAIGQWTIIGCDFENGGNFIRVTSAGSVSNIATFGNAFGGFTGTLFGGAAGRPGSSMFTDEYTQQANRAITSITRSGTTVTAQVSTAMAGGIYKYHAPLANQPITVIDCGAPFDGEHTVATVNVGANTFTYTVADSGATTGTPGFVSPDTSRNYRYSGLFGNALLHDPVASRLILRDRVVLADQKALTGFLPDGITEKDLIRLDSLGRLRLGDGTVFDAVADGGSLQIVKAGEGIVLTNAAGTITKKIRLNSGGTDIELI